MSRKPPGYSPAAAGELATWGQVNLKLDKSIPSIPASTNLDTYTTTGTYAQPTTANAANGVNYPEARAGLLEVYTPDAGFFTYQRWTTYGSPSSNSNTAGRTYVRTKYGTTSSNGTWTIWRLITGLADFDVRNADPEHLLEVFASATQVMQAVARDERNGEWYITQGQVVAVGTGTAENTVVSRLSPSGRLLDTMTLQYAGHGTQINVEVISGVVWLWCAFVTVDANGASTQHDIVRVKYRAGVTQAKADSTNVVVFNKFNTLYSTPYIDAPNDYIIIRTSTGTNDNYYRRKFSEFKAGTDAVYGTILNVPVGTANPGYTFQGVASLGDVLFMYSGTSQGEVHLIRAYSWTTGAVLYTLDVTEVGKEWSGSPIDGESEPEGMTVIYSRAGVPTLVFTKTLGLVGQRRYRFFGITPQREATPLPYYVQAQIEQQAQWQADFTPRGIGTATTIAALNRPGYYYMSSAEFANMTDKPNDASAAGYFLHVSGYNPSRDACIQTLTRLSSVAPDTFTRTSNPQTLVGNAWFAKGRPNGWNSINTTNYDVTATKTTLPNLPTISIPVNSTNEKFLVILDLDLYSLTATAANFIGYLQVDGTDQSVQIVSNQVSVNRTPHSKAYYLTGLSIGTHVIGAAASCSTASKYRISSGHSQITVARL